MADDVPVNSGRNNEKIDEDHDASKKITVHVKTHKDKETFTVPENVSVKDVSWYLHIT